MVVQSTHLASLPISNSVQYDVERQPAVAPQADVLEDLPVPQSRLQMAQNTARRALTVPYDSARALQTQVRARGAGGAFAGVVGGALMGIILDAGLITIGAMVLRHHEPFQSLSQHDGRVILGASIPAAAVVGALLMGINNGAGGGPAGGAGLGALSGLIIGSGLIACGALIHRNHEPFQNIRHRVGDGLIAAGTAGDIIVGALLGALIGLASGEGDSFAGVPMKG